MDPNHNPNHTPTEPDATRAAWERHYGRSKSRQTYPDENLVRLLAPLERGPALDLGCGSGRHLKLLEELGFGPLYGCDSSENSLAISREVCPTAQLFHVSAARETFRLPLPDASVRVLVCWGVLHYNSTDSAIAMLHEIVRVLTTDGVFLGTLRAEGDSHFHTNPDMAGAEIELFDEGGARNFLGSHFASVDLGYALRSPVGELNRRVCHWIFRARDARSTTNAERQLS